MGQNFLSQPFWHGERPRNTPITYTRFEPNSPKETRTGYSFQTCACSPHLALNTQTSFGHPDQDGNRYRKAQNPQVSIGKKSVKILLKRQSHCPGSPPPQKKYTVNIRATITKQLLPIVSANVRLHSLDSATTNPHVSLTKTELPWDTGPSTVVVDELLPKQSSKNTSSSPKKKDCYRSPGRGSVHR